MEHRDGITVKHSQGDDTNMLVLLLTTSHQDHYGIVKTSVLNRYAALKGYSDVHRYTEVDPVGHQAMVLIKAMLYAKFWTSSRILSESCHQVQLYSTRTDATNFWCSYVSQSPCIPPSPGLVRQFIGSNYIQIKCSCYWAKTILKLHKMDQIPAPAAVLRIIWCNCSGKCDRNTCCSCRKNGLLCSLACGKCNGTTCSNIGIDNSTRILVTIHIWWNESYADIMNTFYTICIFVINSSISWYYI